MKYIYKAISILLAFAFIFYINREIKPKYKQIKVENIQELDSVFAINDFFIDSIFTDSLVSAIFTQNISASLKELDAKERKKVFLRMLLPDILLSNKNILEERKILLEIKQKTDLSRKEKKQLKKLAKKYSGKTDDIDELLQRVDIVPPSMALAQTIIESGWGTSRYAIEGNAIFGHHVSKKDTGNYIKSQISDVKMKAFNSIKESVEAYMHNINSTRAYRQLRMRRANSRAENERITGKDLIFYLTRYSERGVEYTNELSKMIRQQKLARFDFVNLSDEPMIIVEVEN